MKPSALPAGTRWVAVDTESSGLHIDDGARISTVSVAYRPAPDADIVCHAWPIDQGILDKEPQGSLLELIEDPNLDEIEWSALLEWLSRQQLVMHNAKHDLHMFTHGTRAWPGVELVEQTRWDTMLAARELDQLEKVGLGECAKRAGLQPKDDGELKRWLKHHKAPTGRYDLAPWDVMRSYAEVDARITLELFELQRRRFEDGDAEITRFEREIEVMKVLYKIEERGIGFDDLGCTLAAMALEEEIERLASALPFEPTVPAAKRFFFETQGVKPYETTDKGEPQLNDAVIRKMERDEVKWASEYSAIRKIQVALDMWYRGYPDKIGPDGRLRTSFRQTGTVSGRYSVSRINLQAIPHAHKLDGLPEGTPTPRSFFQPRPGYGLWELDLQQAELRVAAKMADCRTMLGMIEAGEDLHGYTTKELFGVGPDSPDWFDKRQIGKRANFSLIFGSGADTFREMLWKESSIDLGRTEAIEIVQRWRQLYPEFSRAIDQWSSFAERKGFVELRNGRKRWFGPDEYTHKAFNQVVQGSLAEFAKSWALKTEEHVPGVLVLLIHDSEVLEIEDGREVEVCERVAEIGTRLGKRWFDVAWGVDYGRFGEH